MRARWVVALSAAAVVVGATGGHLLMPADTAVEVGPKPPVMAAEPAEDAPGWNCLTMGNKVCGSKWRPVDQAFAEILAQDARDTQTPGHDVAYFRTCLYVNGDTAWVVCPDGYVMGS